jgi:hypothetical protein
MKLNKNLFIATYLLQNIIMNQIFSYGPMGLISPIMG